MFTDTSAALFFLFMLNISRRLQMQCMLEEPICFFGLDFFGGVILQATRRAAVNRPLYICTCSICALYMLHMLYVYALNAPYAMYIYSVHMYIYVHALYTAYI